MSGGVDIDFAVAGSFDVVKGAVNWVEKLYFYSMVKRFYPRWI